MFEQYNAKYFVKNRKLKLEEYDDLGNLIDVREFSNKDLAEFIGAKVTKSEALDVARKGDIKHFNKEDLVLLKDVLTTLNWSSGEYRGYIRDKHLEFFEKIIAMDRDKLNFIITLLDHHTGGFNTSWDSPYAKKSFTFNEALEFTESREGIYYTVNNNGERVWDFVDKPTLKQYRYQVNKNGNRIVLLSFIDWKVHLITEKDLKL